ncbi:unnamed protein product [Arctia plantaginis]|uniref:Uncharacterized protein n=1 Tax=Arctia plantaginis TaxID=874455 RepID=A0A8S1AIZ8_ARCPL|nr:unnamed protein product [Arctia plantaginis]
MTKIVTLLLAYSLIVSEVHIFFNPGILINKYLTSNLVILLCLCLVLRRVELLPYVLWCKRPKLCFVLEVFLIVVLLELFLHYIWARLKNYVNKNADYMLTYLAEDRGLDGVICHLCCGIANCSSIFADLLLKSFSFTVLFTVCLCIGNK